jgi:hypothetical protein
MNSIATSRARQVVGKMMNKVPEGSASAKALDYSLRR